MTTHSSSRTALGMRLTKRCALLVFAACLIGTLGCSGNDKEIGQQLTGLGATVMNHAGQDGVPATVMLVGLQQGQTVDLEQALPLVSKLSKVESLVLNGTDVTDDQLIMVGKVSSLVDLQLSDTNISDAGIKHISRLPKLKSLYLTNTKVTGACLSDVAKLKTLTGLAINDTSVSGGYEALQALPDLVLLVAGKLTITEENAKNIAKIPALKRLDVNGAKLEGGSLGILESQLDSVSYDAPAAEPSE